MLWILIAIKIAITVFVIKVLMTQAYNILFFLMKKPYLYILFAGAFNIIVFEILRLLFNQITQTYIFNLYGFSAFIALFFLTPPDTSKILSKEEMSNFSDEMTGIKHSVGLYKIGLFAFFVGGIIGSYLIMYQDGIKIFETVTP